MLVHLVEKLCLRDIGRDADQDADTTFSVTKLQLNGLSFS